MRIYKLFTSASALVLTLYLASVPSVAWADVNPDDLAAPEAKTYIQQIADQLSLSRQHVLVDTPTPDTPSILTPAEQAKLEEAIGQRGHPIYVVSLNIWHVLKDPSVFNPDPSATTIDPQYEQARSAVIAAATQQLANDVGKPGVYVVFAGWEMGFSTPLPGNTAGSPVIGNVGMPTDLMANVQFAKLWYSNDASLVSEQPGINCYPLLSRFVSTLNEQHVAPPALNTGYDADAYRAWMNIPASTTVGTTPPTPTQPSTAATRPSVGSAVSPSASSGDSTAPLLLLFLLVLGGPLLGCIIGTVIWVVARRKKSAKRAATQAHLPPLQPFGTMEGQQRVAAGTTVPPAPVEHIPPMHPEHPSVAVTPANVPSNGQAAPGSVVTSSVGPAEDATMPISVIPSTTPLPGDPDTAAPGSTPAGAGTSAD